MNIADRIYELRRQKGISQEELADKLGVSRQAVSKWESEQSTPEMDKVILMSDFFDVTTDYLLKGIEPIKGADKGRKIGNALSVIAPWMAWIGYITSCALWYEHQNAFALMDGFIWMIGAVVIIYAAKLNGLVDQKAVNRCWMIAFPAISMFLLSMAYNAFSGHILAPYPLLFAERLTAFGIWLVLLVIVNAAVELVLYRGIKK